jgi:hypothetical protein
VGGELFGVVHAAEFVDGGFGGGDLVQAPAVVDDLVGAGFFVYAYGLVLRQVLGLELAEGFLFFGRKKQRVAGESMFGGVLGGLLSPSGDRGPELSFEFCWFAFICSSVVIVGLSRLRSSIRRGQKSINIQA